MRVALGGTFQILHKGHKKLIEEAFKLGDDILIGITSDEFASKTRHYTIRPFELRKMEIENFVKNFNKKYEIRKIEDHYGPTIEEDFDLIVVSHETYRYALEINYIRKMKGMKEMIIHNIGRVLADDLIPISSSRIVEGKIDPEGKRLKQIVIRTSTKNKQKIKAIEDAFKKLMKNIFVEGIEFNSRIKQPYGEQTLQCAIERAKNAIGDGDYGVGIESGLFWHPTIKKYFDVHYVVIIDSLGNINFSSSMGFAYPENIINNLKGKTISDSFQYTYNIKDLGTGDGAIGFLTNGKIKRKDIMEEAIYLALLQKKSEYYYL
ncbi:MAG: pantetheine-phosphate adenylyltransferase [Thermoplasmata archaeon]